jgi:DNA mismatch repair protein MutS2
MDRDTFSVLQWTVFLDRLAGYAQGEPGRRWCRGLSPSPRIDEVRARLDLALEAGRWLAEEGFLSLGGVEEVGPLCDRIQVEGTYLPVEDLGPILDAAATATEVKRVVTRRQRDFPKLAGVADALKELPELVGLIESVIGPGQTVAEDASPALGRLRRRERALRRALRENLASWVREPGLGGAVQDDVVVERGGRYVVPIKAEAAARVPGIVHDRSQTRATVFVEPLEAVDRNNEINDCRRAVVEEEIRLLRQVADLIRRDASALVKNGDALGHLDGLLAVARFSAKIGATRPEVAESGPLRLKAAVHPLLFWRGQGGGPPAQPIDLIMDADVSGLILSGANAGGKTAALKTLGLLTLMVQAGLPLPAADGSRVVVFEEVLVAGDEEQDLSGDKSTFSAHLTRLRQVLEAAGPRSLVLIDELAAGTDPSEAAALGMAVLDELLARGSRVVVTTHLHLLKAYAAGHDEVVNVSVGRDEVSGRPSYILRYGLPGLSNALKVAAEVGLSPDLVERARDYFPEGETATWRLIADLEDTKTALETERQKLQKTLDEAGAERDKWRRVRSKLAEARTKILDQERTRVRRVVNEAQTELRRLLKDVKEPAAPARPDETAAEARRSLGRVERRVEDALRPRAGRTPSGDGLNRASMGDAVYVPRLGKEATLLEDLAGQERVEVLIDRVKVNLPAADLAAAGGRPPASIRTRLTWTGRPAARPELNLIGRRVDEALTMVDRHLDQAVLSGLNRVEIIHGVGTGALRRAIHQHLAEIPEVKSFASPTSRPGGMGVTVVDLA